MVKAPKIGLSQAQRLCQMPQSQQLGFIAQGLPVILSSAKGFWQAVGKLRDHAREALVLERHAEEEAAKVLILMDMVRCPPHLLPSRMGDLVRCFYSHLARLLYAEAVTWRPTDVSELRQYIDSNRRSHDLEGEIGEYIVPNFAIFNRESVLYSDIAAYEGEETSWNDPKDYINEFSYPDHPPRVLELAESMSLLGMFTHRGLELTAKAWKGTDFRDQEGLMEARALTGKLVNSLIGEGLTSDDAEDEHVRKLIFEWPLPMYHLDFNLIPVSLADLKEKQDSLFWREMGADYY